MEIRIGYSGNWRGYADECWRLDEAKVVRDNNLVITDTVEFITRNITDKLSKAKAIYNYVRKNIKTNNENPLAESDPSFLQTFLHSIPVSEVFFE